MLHSLHLHVSVLNVLIHKARFQPHLPTAINMGMKTNWPPSLKHPPKQAQVHFSKVTAFKSLSVDMSMIGRLMPSTSKRMDGASTPR